MLKQIARLKVGLILLLGILLFSSGAFAMADRRVINSRDNRRDSREERHYYRDGRWYKHDSRGNEIAVTDLVIGALVEALPPQHTTVVIQGTQYYHDGNHYYRPAPSGGYVVVQQPVKVQPRSQSNYDKQGDRGGNSHNEGNRDENH